MEKFLETIKIVNGAAPFLTFHNERLNHTRQTLFNAKNKIDLKEFIQAPSQNEIYRCRIIYSQRIEAIEYSPFQVRSFKTFKIVENDNITYPFKYLDRTPLNQLMQYKEQADDILIIKGGGMVTDTSIANVAFWIHNEWLTPLMPLLKGTTRERFLKNNKIVAAPIRLEDLKNVSKMAIMNALIGFYLINDFKLILDEN